jgi:ABC-type nitrate/sulfonate/bicarbonate transport system permease component
MVAMNPVISGVVLTTVMPSGISLTPLAIGLVVAAALGTIAGIAARRVRRKAAALMRAEAGDGLRRAA